MRYIDLQPGDAFYDTDEEYCLLVVCVELIENEVLVTYMRLFGDCLNWDANTLKIDYASHVVIRPSVEVWRS